MTLVAFAVNARGDVLFLHVVDIQIALTISYRTVWAARRSLIILNRFDIVNLCVMKSHEKNEK